MPLGQDSDDASGGAPPRLSLWHRFLLSLPKVSRDSDKPPLGERFRNAVVKPVESDSAPAKSLSKKRSVEELEAEVKWADDKERLIGLIAAPVSAAIGILVVDALIANDPPARLKSGHLNSAHVNVSVYHNLTLVILALSLLMLVTAWFRKRLYLGIVMALFGLTLFNLRYWGFGVPFVLAGAWYIVRAYRLNRDLRDATGDGRSRSARGGGSPTRSGLSANKRYTPRAAPAKKPQASKRGDEKQAG
ncbi:MAG TPA: hypothetical protein VEJ87_16065 [Acidimicrobiales bacterium]|nr:hypothetical protein [Acidimicrobiales bacterium]